MTAYEYTNPAEPSPDTSTSYAHAGCYADDSDDRAMERSFSDNAMTIKVTRTEIRFPPHSSSKHSLTMHVLSCLCFR